MLKRPALVARKHPATFVLRRRNRQLRAFLLPTTPDNAVENGNRALACALQRLRQDFPRRCVHTHNSSYSSSLRLLAGCRGGSIQKLANLSVPSVYSVRSCFSYHTTEQLHFEGFEALCLPAIASNARRYIRP